MTKAAEVDLWPQGPRAASSALWLTAALSQAWRSGLLRHMATAPCTLTEMEGLLAGHGTVSSRRVEAVIGLLEAAAIVIRTEDNRFRVAPTVPVESPALGIDRTIVNAMLDEEFFWRRSRTAGYFSELTEEQRLGFALTMEDQVASASAAVVGLADEVRCEHLVDIGGGTGAIARAVVAAGLAERATCLDLDPTCLAVGRQRAEACGLAGRVSFVRHDFHSDELPRADLYVLSRVLHDWDDETGIRLLRGVRSGFIPPGRVLVHEEILRPGAWWAAALDFFLATMLGDGRVRTLAEFADLCRAADLRIDRLEDVDSCSSLLLCSAC